MLGKLPPEISLATARKAYKCGRNAENIGLDIGPVRFQGSQWGNVIAFYVSNGPDIVVIFCSEHLYFAEYYHGAHTGGTDYTFLAIKNIRNFLYYLKRKRFVDFDKVDSEIKDAHSPDTPDD